MAAKKQKRARVPSASKEEREHRIALFVEAMIQNGGNRTQAAIAAGYAKVSAHVQGNRLMKLPAVAEALAARRAALEAKTGLTTERVLKNLEQVLFFDPRTLYNEDGTLKPLQELDEAAAMALQSIDTDEIYEGAGKDRVKVGETRKIRFADRNTAREQAMKHLGLYEIDNSQRRPVGVAIGELTVVMDFDAAMRRANTRVIDVKA